jgi:hypothetical protein
MADESRPAKKHTAEATQSSTVTEFGREQLITALQSKFADILAAPPTGKLELEVRLCKLLLRSTKRRSDAAQRPRALDRNSVHRVEVGVERSTFKLVDSWLKAKAASQGTTPVASYTIDTRHEDQNTKSDTRSAEIGRATCLPRFQRENWL